MFPWIYNNFWIHDDKVLHFIFAFIITAWILILCKIIDNRIFLTNQTKIFNLKRIIIITSIILLILWIGKEIKDYFTPWRNVEILDIITNYIWMFFFYCCYYIIWLFKNKF